MITYVSTNASRQASLAMPISRCDDAAWRLRALPVFTGRVSAGAATTGLVATDVHMIPGTPAWRQPT